ncbi:hypothetical protein EMPS_08565 [Entomortierella parvispora]|uniref:Uncharacterized protein n=1 Tax=Entomortierella parvispora TaxID=205924 RepID=A0A9P3HGL9_9FUNG|nr:hypothetical protein EMPS_08565 [Entomortierella parvispora]
MPHLLNTVDSTLLSSLFDNQEAFEWSTDTLTTTPSQHPDSARLSFTEDSFTNVDTSLDFLQGIENPQFGSNTQIQDLFGQQQQAVLDAAMEVDGNWDLDELSLLLELSNCPTESTTASAASARTATKSVPLAPTSPPKSTTHIGHIPPREMKNPEEKEDFVHPGFYSLPTSSAATPTHSACASPYTPHAPPPMPSGKKRPLRDEDLMEVVLASQHSYGHSHRQHHVAQAALANRRHSCDTAPYSTSIAGSPAARNAMAQRLLQQQQQQQQHPRHHHHQENGVPPGQPFVATCSSPSGGNTFAEYLASLSQLGQAPFSPSTKAARGMVTSPSSSSSPNGRKRRSSKFKMEAELGRCSESLMRMSASTSPCPYGSPLLGPRLVPTQAAVSSNNAHNALPPPLQQHRNQQAAQSPLHLLQHHPHPGQPHVQTKSVGTRRHGQSASLSSSSSTSSSSPSGGSTHQRRNPAEVSSSTLPPDHFIFKEAMMGLNRQSLDGGCLNTSAYRSSSTAAGSSNRHDSASATPRMTTMHRRRSEPVNSYSHIHSHTSLSRDGQGTTRSPSFENGMGGSEQKSRMVSSHDASFEGTEASIPSRKKLLGKDSPQYPQFLQKQQQAYHPYFHKMMTPPRSLPPVTQSPLLPSQKDLVDALNGAIVSNATSETPILGQKRFGGDEGGEQEDGAAFAQSLLMLDPITTKLMDQLRLQEYLRSEQERSGSLSSASSSAPSDQDKELKVSNGTSLSTETATVVTAALATSTPHTPTSDGEPSSEK